MGLGLVFPRSPVGGALVVPTHCPLPRAVCASQLWGGPGGPGLTGWALPRRPGPPTSRCGLTWGAGRWGGARRGVGWGAHLALLLLQLNLDVGELGPQLLVGGLQSSEGLGPVPLAPAAHALLGHGEGGLRGAGGRPPVWAALSTPSWGRCRLAATLLHFLIHLEGEHTWVSSWPRAGVQGPAGTDGGQAGRSPALRTLAGLKACPRGQWPSISTQQGPTHKSVYSLPLWNERLGPQFTMGVSFMGLWPPGGCPGKTSRKWCFTHLPPGGRGGGALCWLVAGVLCLKQQERFAPLQNCACYQVWGAGGWTVRAGREDR